MKKIMILVAMLFLCATLAIAADLKWDDPGEQWEIISGYVVYYTDGTEQFNKQIFKADVVRADGTVTYTNFEPQLNLAYGVEYTFYITAFNDAGESEPSNSVTYLREGFVPPTDVLPAAVSLPQSPVNLGI